MNSLKLIFMLFVVFLIFLIQSCIKDNPKVKIKNNSTYLIDSVKIFAYKGINETVFRNIKPKESCTGNIIFENIPKHDGVSAAVFYYNQKEVHKGLGYYTNGTSLDNSFHIIIENDTIIVKRY